jgi:hypothetical protein
MNLNDKLATSTQPHVTSNNNSANHIALIWRTSPPLACAAASCRLPLNSSPPQTHTTPHCSRPTAHCVQRHQQPTTPACATATTAWPLAAAPQRCWHGPAAAAAAGLVWRDRPQPQVGGHRIHRRAGARARSPAGVLTAAPPPATHAAGSSMRRSCSRRSSWATWTLGSVTW